MSLNNVDQLSNRSTPLTEEASRAILNDSLTRETAYLDGLNDAIAVLDDTYTDLNDNELRKEPVIQAFLRDRLGCFAAGVCAGLIGATVAAGVSAAGLLPLSVLQILLLGGGLVAIFFYRDPFHVNQDALAHEAAVRRRLLEMRRAKMEYRIADGTQRASTARAALGAVAVTSPAELASAQDVTGQMQVPTQTEPQVQAARQQVAAPQQIGDQSVMDAPQQGQVSEAVSSIFSPSQAAVPTNTNLQEPEVDKSLIKRKRKVSRMRLPKPDLAASTNSGQTDQVTTDHVPNLLPAKG